MIFILLILCLILFVLIIFLCHKKVVICIPKRKRFDWNRVYRKTDQKDYGIFNPCMTDKAVVDELCSYFLGDDWFDSSGALNREQVNTAIVCTIEQKYKGVKINKNYVIRRMKEEDVF